MLFIERFTQTKVNTNREHSQNYQTLKLHYMTPEYVTSRLSFEHVRYMSPIVKGCTFRQSICVSKTRPGHLNSKELRTTCFYLRIEWRSGLVKVILGHNKPFVQQENTQWQYASLTCKIKRVFWH